MTQLKTKSKYKSIIHIVEALIFMILKFFPLCIILQTDGFWRQANISLENKPTFSIFYFFGKPNKNWEKTRSDTYPKYLELDWSFVLETSSSAMH